MPVKFEKQVCALSISPKCNFRDFFKEAVGFEPYSWQAGIAQNGIPPILPVPTGFGKTEGAVLAWAWRRFMRQDEDEPLHLIYCLPMRTLVRQTVDRLRSCFDKLRDILYCPVEVYQLMAGAIETEWAGRPDAPWVLVGTQDQLLSRALNRGYSMNRFEWPVHFGLLNQDCRWIVDEIQLMGPGLWTTAQLDWMREKRFASIKSCRTTWMSATLATSFLETTDRKASNCHSLPVPTLNFNDPTLGPRQNAVRCIHWTKARGLKSIADQVVKRHQPGTLSLVVCNTVEVAREIFCCLPESAPKILLTSRFRRQDREQSESRLIQFESRRRQQAETPPADPGLICVSTQVVEAGLDISAHHLWSELAPWPSIIQRLGRLNRDGRDTNANAWFWEPMIPPGKAQDERDRIGPYPRQALKLAKKLLDSLIPLSENLPFGQALNQLQQSHGPEIVQALQVERAPMPRAMDLHDLFSTEPDVHGGFTDVSSFIRSSDPDTDVTVFWRDWPGKNSWPPKGDNLDGPDLDLDREACPVPVFRLQEFLKSQNASAWCWADESEQWERIDRSEIRPGMVIMLHREIGGYTPALGWTGDPGDYLGLTPRAGRGRALRDDARTEIGVWVTLEQHLHDAQQYAEEICQALRLDDCYRIAVVESAAFHDIGKAHPQWQQALPALPAPDGGLWAKCPRVLAVDTTEIRDEIRDAVRLLSPGCLELETQPRGRGREKWHRMRWAVATSLKPEELQKLTAISGVRWAGLVPFRPGLRHEAASALAMWQRYREGRASYPALAVYLAAAHHGKVRTVLRSISETGLDVFGVQQDTEVIEVNGKTWRLDFTAAKDGAEGQWVTNGFLLAGAGWTGLVADLLGPWQPQDTSHANVIPEGEPKRLGPFALAYLEALVRAADWRSSSHPSQCVQPEEVSRERGHA